MSTELAFLKDRLRRLHTKWRKEADALEKECACSPLLELKKSVRVTALYNCQKDLVEALAPTSGGW